MSQLGQSRHSNRAPLTSGFPQLADILGVSRHVSTVAGASRGRGVARLLSDCHAAAVEAREGEALEGFAEGSALVPQHADSHFLADCH
jgi:hypothetical protein